VVLVVFVVSFKFKSITVWALSFYPRERLQGRVIAAFNIQRGPSWHSSSIKGSISYMALIYIENIDSTISYNLQALGLSYGI
jgi:hypothetical protein